MRDSTWYFLMDDDVPKDGKTPWETVHVARLPGEPGRLARNHLAKRVRKAVYKIALKLTRSPQAAKELTQDFITDRILNEKFYTVADQKRGSFHSYVAASLYNYFRSQIAREGRLKTERLEGRDVADMRQTMEVILTDELAKERIREAWTLTKIRLESDPTAVKVTHYWLFVRDPTSGETEEEAARKLGIPLSTFKKALKRGKDMLWIEVHAVIQSECQSVKQADKETEQMVRVLDTGILRRKAGPAGDEGR